VGDVIVIILLSVRCDRLLCVTALLVFANLAILAPCMRCVTCVLHVLCVCCAFVCVHAGDVANFTIHDLKCVAASINVTAADVIDLKKKRFS